MSKNLAMWGPGFRDFDRYHVGFDRLLETGADMMQSSFQNYPPYNIVRDGDKYMVEIAVAGFDPNEISVNVAENKLTVTGTHSEESKNVKALYRGIANRSFTRSFVLDDQVQVVGADMANGMLSISLERIVPEHMKPRKIEIQSGQKQLLNE
jgi:molecular chaperone IbpA